MSMTKPPDSTPLAQTFRKMRQHANSLQGGTRQITPSAADTVTNLTVTFDTPFATPPVVVTGVITGITGTGNVIVWASSITATGCILSVKRSNTTPTTVTFLAFGVGVES